MTKTLGPAIVTGAAAGIGRAIAVHLANLGHSVVLADVDEAALAQTTANLQEPQRALAVRCDVSVPADVEQLLDTTLKQLGPVRSLVNAAGIYPMIPFDKMSVEDWDRILGINLKGAFLCSQAAARQMTANGIPGRIVNISSTASRLGRAGHTAYASSKAGLNGLTRALAAELAPANICVNAVCPGLIASDRVIESAANPESAARMKAQLDHLPLARMGTPEEIADMVAYLLGPGAAYITGAELVVDGGYTSGLAG